MIPNTKISNFKMEKEIKIGAGKTNGGFCKQGGPPHNTIGLKYKSIQKLVHCFSSILYIPYGFHKECQTKQSNTRLKNVGGWNGQFIGFGRTVKGKIILLIKG